MSVDPLRVSCDEPAPDGGQPCGAGIGRPCIVWQRSSGNPRNWIGEHVEPHASRYAKAHHADHPTSAARYLVAGVPVLGSDLEPIARLIRARQAMPLGFDAVVRVLGCHGTFAVLPDRLDPLGHIRAAWRHGLRTRDAVDLAARAEWPRDAETGELHAAHEAGRALIACELVGRGRR